MKVIVIGLGNFGLSLSLLLSEMGHEVIAVDQSLEKVERIKDNVTYVVSLDATDIASLKGLPLKDTDIAVVAIGENEGASIMSTANLKSLGLKRIISRSISSTHDTVLQAMGIHEIVHPEQDAAERLSKKINLNLSIESFDIDNDFSLAEVVLPKSFIGKRVGDLDLRKHFGVNIVTIIHQKELYNALGTKRYRYATQGVIGPEYLLNEGDLLVVFGSNENILSLTNLEKH